MDLRGAALGTSQGRGNYYRGVDFSGADLREATFIDSLFKDCDFSGARLDGVEFWATKLEACRFAGRMKDVIFHLDGVPVGLRAGSPGWLRGVDFRDAEFDWVQFEGVDCSEVVPPDDDDVIVLDPYAAQLADVLQVLQRRGDPPAREARISVSVELERAQPGQAVGLINLRDISEVAGREAAELLRSILTR